jgi:hypothetical protein
VMCPNTLPILSDTHFRQKTVPGVLPSSHMHGAKSWQSLSSLQRAHFMFVRASMRGAGVSTHQDSEAIQFQLYLEA